MFALSESEMCSLGMSLDLQNIIEGIVLTSLQFDTRKLNDLIIIGEYVVPKESCQLLSKVANQCLPVRD